MDNKKKTILVTGGAGFIGSHLVDALLLKGFRVRVLDNLKNGTLDHLRQASRSNRYEFVEGDIRDEIVSYKAMKGIDIVYHMACLGVRHSIHSPIENHEVNSEGTLKILNAAKTKGVKRFFYISTSEIYGGVHSFPIQETDLPHPFTVYGASKLAGEYYTHVFHRLHNLDAVVIRLFNNYGPRAHYEGDAGELIPRAIVSILNDEAPVIFGDGRVTRDFLYVKDTAEALIQFMGITHFLDRTFNVGMGLEMSIRFVVENILKRMSKEKLGIRYLDSRPADVPRLWVNTSRFYQLTEFKPAYSFESGLDETIDYYRDLNQNNDLMSKVIIRNWEEAK